MDRLNFTHGHSNSAGGVDKPRGLENARLQHERERERPARPRDGVGPAAVVSLRGGAQEIAATEATNLHVAPRLASVEGSGTLIIGEGANVHINTRGESGGGSGTLIVGEGANVHINSRFEHAGGAGTLIVGEGANVHINTRGESGGGSGTLIVSAGANVHVNARLANVDVDVDATLVASNEAKLHVNARVETTVASDGRAVSPRTVEEAAELALRERGRHVTERYQPPAPARLAQTVLDVPPNDRDRLARTQASNWRGAAERREGPAYVDPRLGMMRELIDSVREGWEERAAKERRGPKGAKPENDAKEARQGSEGKAGAASEDSRNDSGSTRAAEIEGKPRGQID